MLAFEVFYLLLATLLSLYGLQRFILVIELWRRAPAPIRERWIEASEGGEPLPHVLVQLPVYNDGAVFLRLLDSVSEIDYPRELLTIQVLDDSDDGSSAAIATRVQQLSKQGHSIEHRQRTDRSGYKAGALAEGLEHSDAPFVAMFDSDFVVAPNTLKRLLPELQDPEVAFVQARWAFANPNSSLLTRVQAWMLDGHFALEHEVRSRGERFFNFNGTAGIWRREAIDDAGGWRDISITEDLDLSLRAWFRGWRFSYRGDVTVPSDLPTAMSAYRTQQNRWVSGSIQTAGLMLPRILAAPTSYWRKLDLALAVTGNFCYPLIILLAFALPHAIAIRLAERDRFLLYADVPFFLLATGSVALFYWRARGGRTVGESIRLLPALMALGMGMALHNSRAVFRGLSGGATVFERTPKAPEAVAPRRRRRDLLPWAEGGMLLYLLTIGLYAREWVALYSLPLVGLLAAGTGLVLYSRLREASGERSVSGDQPVSRSA